jgi:hypothetical protein
LNQKSEMNIFGESDSEEEVYIDPIKRLAMKQAEEAKKLESNTEVFLYDQVYESLNEKRKNEEEIKRIEKEKEKGKSKYIEKLLETSKERKLYQEHVKDLKIIKKNEEEKEIYGDTEVFYTKAYEEQLIKQKRLKEKFEDESKQIIQNKSNFLSNILEVKPNHEEKVEIQKHENLEIKEKLKIQKQEEKSKEVQLSIVKKFGEKPNQEIIDKAKERAMERMNIRLSKK